MKRLPVLLFIFFFIPALAFAAGLRFEKPTVSVHAGDTFTIALVLDSGADTLNALEGSVAFSSNLLLRDIRYSGSLVPLWILQPEERKGAVTFAGVLPGGFQGSGNIFTLVFEARAEGLASVSLDSDTVAYKNDGDGTRAALSPETLSFSVLPASASPQEVVLPSDTTPPEGFVPLIVPGEPFGYTGMALIFETQDKNSGISHFEIARSYNQYAKEADLSWERVDSPYEIKPSIADKYLFVRATDKAGNAYTATVAPQKMSFALFIHEWWLAGVFLALLGVVLLVRFLWYRRRAEHSILQE